MAAVAGSKGRIKMRGEHVSFQADLAAKVLRGEISELSAAQSLIEAAILREVGVDTNMLCNLSCAYCYLNDRPESKGRVSPATWAANLLPLADVGCKLFAFIGKEPLADNIALHTISLLNAAHGRERFRVGMVTNGTFIGRKLSQLAASKLDYLDVSLDALSAINDEQRGEGVYSTVIQNIRRYLSLNPMHDFSVTSVLHRGSAEAYPEFIELLFSMGVKTVFGSPVLRFTQKDTARSIALTADNVVVLLASLERYASTLQMSEREDRQIIIDLPYKYSWALLSSGVLDASEIKQDAYEAHCWRPRVDLPLFVKFNFFPMSYWRAIRITHDGHVLENMDLAAHRHFDKHARPCADMADRWYFGRPALYQREFLEAFVAQHAAPIENVYDRDIQAQFHMMNQSSHTFAARSFA